MSKGNTFESDILGLIFNADPIDNIADNAGTGPLTNLYVALHTATPGEAGDQTTNECAYTSYARVAVARSGSGWTVSGNSVSPAADITFPQATGGSEVATYASVGVAASSTSKILYYGALSSSISISSGVTPVVGTGSTIAED